MMDLSGVLLFDDFEAESFTLCPASLCGESDTHYMFAGKDGKVKVLRLGNLTEIARKGSAELVDEFDVASVLCSIIGRCKPSPPVTLSGVRTLGDSVFIVSQTEQELYKLQSSKSHVDVASTPKALDSAVVIPLPGGPGWWGMDIYSAAPSNPGAEVLVLASDVMGIVEQFNVESNNIRWCQK
jgi:hypothetical protein